jgi:hypothetical protein
MRCRNANMIQCELEPARENDRTNRAVDEEGGRIRYNNKVLSAKHEVDTYKLACDWLIDSVLLLTD